MALVDSLERLILAIRGVSTYAPPTDTYFGPELGSPSVDTVRRAMGGNLEPIPVVRTRWYQKDVERAKRQAANGDLRLIGQLHESMKGDGVIRGMGGARCSFVGFPKRFYGNPDIVEVLKSRNWSSRNVYDEMIPQNEAQQLAFDGEDCGFGLGEMRPVEGRDFPVLVRLYPQNLWYWWARNVWMYRSVAGSIPIHPGVPNKDGGWFVLYTPGGRNAPWNNGVWESAARSYIGKTEAIFARQSYLNKHAHPLRVGEFAMGSSEKEQRDFVTGLITWALNSVAALPSGWKTYLVESNGQGIKVYQDAIKTFNEEIATTYCGSSVMLQGTVGFGNADPFKMVAKDLMQTSAGNWDHFVSTQILTPFIGLKWGVEDVRNATYVETDITPPKDQKAEADVLLGLGNAIKALTEALIAHKKDLDVAELLERFGVPFRDGLPPNVTTTPAGEKSAPGAGPPAPSAAGDA